VKDERNYDVRHRYEKINKDPMTIIWRAMIKRLQLDPLLFSFSRALYNVLAPFTTKRIMNDVAIFILRQEVVDRKAIFHQQ
jgi:hypothetical protein